MGFLHTRVTKFASCWYLWTPSLYEGRAITTVPLAFGTLFDTDTIEVEPLNFTLPQSKIQDSEQPPYNWPNINSHCINPVGSFFNIRVVFAIQLIAYKIFMQGPYLRIITSYHLAIGDLPTVTICGLIWVNRKIQLHVDV